MKHLILVTMKRDSDVGRQYEAGTLASPELMVEMGKLMEKLRNSGKLLDVSVLVPRSKGARVRGAAGKVSVTDVRLSNPKRPSAAISWWKQHRSKRRSRSDGAS